MLLDLMGLERSEHLLKKPAAKHNYNWSKVALEMKHEFGDEFADEDTLERRHALLSLTSGTYEMGAEVADPGAFHVTRQPQQQSLYISVC